MISTGDDEIRDISNEWLDTVGAFQDHKARVIKRPKRLCEDVDSSLVIKSAVEWFERNKNDPVSYAVTLQPTSPLRSHHDIDSCIHLAKSCRADTVVSVKKVDEHPAWCFETDIFGRLIPYINTRLEGNNLVSQNLPLLWYPNGAVYVTNRATIDQGKIFGDYMIPYQMPRWRSIDLEEEIDFMICSAVFNAYKESEPFLVKGCDDE